MINYLENNNDGMILINRNSYSVFEKIVNEMYNDTKVKFMCDSVEYLDRHKVAAIIVLSLLETPFIQPCDEETDGILVKKYEVALSAGLSYMQYELNHIRILNNEQPIGRYKFPEIMHGNLSYKDNLVRLLYFENKNNSTNILTLAHVFFLIENYNSI